MRTRLSSGLLLATVLAILGVGVTSAVPPPGAPATYVDLTPGARVVVNNVPKYPSEGNYGTIGTAVSKIYVRIRRVNDDTGEVYVNPNDVEAALTPEIPPDAGYVSSGTWSATQEIAELPNCRYYSKALIHKKKANGQHDSVPATNSDYHMH